jgi:hypothetical protein
MISASLLKLKLIGSESGQARKWFGVMSVINALFSTAFLILVAVSAAVTSCMVVLALFDRAFRKEKGTERGRESLLDQGHGVIDQGNKDEADDDALASIHAEQMRKFGVSQSTLKEHSGRPRRYRTACCTSTPLDI